MFKQLTLAATIAATATFAAPGAQAFSLGDALGIANTVINTVQTIENEVNNNAPAPQIQQPQQVQQPTAQYNTVAPSSLCEVDSLGLHHQGMIEILGPSWGCTRAQMNVAINHNRGLQQECNMRGFDKYEGGKCTMY